MKNANVVSTEPGWAFKKRVTANAGSPWEELQRRKLLPISSRQVPVPERCRSDDSLDALTSSRNIGDARFESLPPLPKRKSSEEECPRRPSRNLITRHARGSSFDEHSFAAGGAHRRTHSAEVSGSMFGTSELRDGLRTHTPVSFRDRSDVQKSILTKDIEQRQLKLASRGPNLLEARLSERDPGVPLKRLLVIQSTLPLTLFYDEEAGTFSHDQDPFESNVVDVLSQVKESSVADSFAEIVLIGAPVLRRNVDNSIIAITEDLQNDLATFLRDELKDLKVVPVFTDTNRDRFAKTVLLPLFHYAPPSVENGLGKQDWEGYELVNEQFRDAAINEYSPKRGDIVWINDYSLMLLPKMLRIKMPDIHIGYYMDCVFPSSEIYRVLPRREELLRGVLSANLIGFHNFVYARHFLTSCTRVLGLECSSSSIEACEDAGGTCTKVVNVPLGMDLQPYERVLEKEETKSRIQEFHEIFHAAGKKILVSVDRLEEKMGIPHKIMAFHKFLQREPKWATKCVFVQIVETVEDSPGEESMESDSKQNLLQQIYQMVGECNSCFGAIGHLPVHFIYQGFNPVDIAALVVNADVMIDTPLRDMMSRSAHVFLRCQEDASNAGVLIISEFSGSAQSLRGFALCVNPWDTNGFSDAMQDALEMSEHERTDLHRYGHKYVSEYTIKHWAVNFLEEMQAAVEECEKERLDLPLQLDHEKAVVALRKARRRIIILGFSGTLLPRKSRIQAKLLPKLSEVLLTNLQVIAEDPNTDVIIFSGFGREDLQRALGDVPCWIIAEGGFCYRSPAAMDEWHTFEEQRDNDWLGPVQDIMAYFADRTPGSTVINSSCSVTWHYQKTQGDHAAIQSKDMLIHLWAGPLMSAPAEVVVGSDYVSVRPTGVNKANTLEVVLRQICNDDEDKTSQWLASDSMIICISDLSIKDEEVFVSLQKFFEVVRTSPPSQCLEGLHERELTPMEEKNLEANSKSLNELMLGRSASREPEDTSFGNLLDMFSDSPPLLPKVPSESDLTRIQQTDVQLVASDSNYEAVDDDPKLFTCTVNRKATRAQYHLSDTNDVAFLIAQFARELRRAGNEYQGLHPFSLP